MVERSVTIQNPSGMHARPAALFVQTAAKYKSTSIKVLKDGRMVDAKSLLSMLSLGASKGSLILIRAEGPDEQVAVDALVSLVEGGLGEEAGR